MEPTYAQYVAELAVTDPTLAAEFSTFQSISSVLAWMQAQGLTRTTVDIVGQDEFHYDFLIFVSTYRWVSFGVT